MQFLLLKLFIPITIIIFLFHPTSTTYVLAQDLDSYYQPTADCWTTLGCGNITNITYPFWGPNRPAYCGHPGFEINCADDLTLLININELPYKILKIDFNSNTLIVSRTDTLCDYFYKNTTVDSNLFKFTSDLENISLYYQCQIPNASSPSVNEFTCNNSVSRGYYVTERQRIEGAVVPKCYQSVVVPAFVSAVSFVYSNPSADNLREALKQGFGLQWNADNSLCQSCVESGGYCGHNLSANAFYCLCRDRSYPFVCRSTISRRSARYSLSPAAFGIIVPVIVFSCLGCCWFFTYTKRGRLWVKSMFFGLKKTKQDEKIEIFIMNYQSLIANRYSYRDVSKMTNSFVDKLGQGGFGDVYKGKLPDDRLVAVKVLNKSTSDGEDFINEVATISRTSHVNIVTLLGFCYESTKRALIYEYLPNGSLDKYINDHNSKRLEQKTLYEISIGIARGLEYLHRGCNTRIVHFDIKPHNILLDESFCPKIADFGLAKLCKGKESIVSMLGARGTAGYIAPEVFMRDFGGVSYKSDVYSYGMMILEMFAGKETNYIDVGISQTSEIYFSDWIYKHLEPGMITRVHENVSEVEEETVRRMIIIGLWCIQTNPTDRPSMTKVLEMLEGSLESLQIPPKPCLFSASNTAPKFSSITSSSSSSSYSLSTKEDKALSLAEAEKIKSNCERF